MSQGFYFKCLTLINLLFFNYSTVFSATFYFNKLFVATGTSYTISSQSYSTVSNISGSNFYIFQSGAQFSGNNVNCELKYYNSSNSLVTLYGTISRQNKSGNDTRALNFIVSDNSYTSYTGAAYIIIMPGYESTFAAGDNITTSSDPFLSALNSALSSSNTIELTSAAGTVDQSICLNSAISNITYNTTGATGATFSDLPAGVTGSWSSNQITISGTPTSIGVNNFLITLSGGSGSGTAVGKITIITGGTLSGSQTIALPSQTSTTFSTDGTANGSWQSLSTSIATISSSNATSAVISGVSAGTSNIRYSVTSGSTTCLSTRDVTVTGSLPVTWLSFTATKQFNTVQLNWATASETNTRDFVVEYSNNAQQWTSLSTIPAAGNSTTTRNYSYVHQNPLKGNNYNYYRILQRDIDDKFSYSKIVSIIFNEPGADLQVYPNPVQDQLTIFLAESQLVRLVNAAGATVWKGQLPAGRNTIPVKTYSKGIYVLTAGMQSQRVLIQ